MNRWRRGSDIVIVAHITNISTNCEGNNFVGRFKIINLFILRNFVLHLKNKVSKSVLTEIARVSGSLIRKLFI